MVPIITMKHGILRIWLFTLLAMGSACSSNTQCLKQKSMRQSKSFLSTYAIMLSFFNSYFKVLPFFQVWIGLLLSIFACIGCIQLLTFLTRKYSGSYDRFPHITASSTSMFILGTLTNHSIWPIL